MGSAGLRYRDCQFSLLYVCICGWDGYVCVRVVFPSGYIGYCGVDSGSVGNVCKGPELRLVVIWGVRKDSQQSVESLLSDK